MGSERRVFFRNLQQQENAAVRDAVCNNCSISSKIGTLKLGVSKRILMLTAGIIWIGVAIMLNALSYSWLRHEKYEYIIMASAVGFTCALIIHHFGFLRIVDKNLARIISMEGRQCILSFMSWKSYLLVMVMAMMGLLLRHSPIPKLYLAVLYCAIGTALLLSGIRYLRYSINHRHL
jgi:hypothetical protein